MATTNPRPTSDCRHPAGSPCGTCSWRVEWRRGGRGGSRESCTFPTRQQASLYHSGQLEGLPPELVTRDGTPKPMSEWTGGDYQAWQQHRDTSGHATVVRLGSSATLSYDRGVQSANTTLNKDVFNN